ncbi:MAG: LysR family transcriptional regulator [Tissierellia bacterium]|nr:LysR family transcriptional regulator [Tissierellia bacterium]
MDLRILEYFIAVAEHQNFSRASDVLHISQPTLSRQIALLEEEMGTPLLIRTKPNVQLTLAGEVCLEKSKYILDQYKSMKYTISEIRKGNVGSVSIGYVNLSQFKVLSNAIEHLHEKHPEIKLKVKQMSLPEIQEAILNKELDIGFDMRISIDESEDILYKKISDSRLYAVVPGKHKFANRESISFKELKDEKLVLYERKQAPELFDSMVNLSAQFGFTLNFTAFSDDMESVIMLVGLGQGITLMDETAKILETKHTIFVPINDCETNYNWYLSWHKDNNNQCIQTVINNISN